MDKPTGESGVGFLVRLASKPTYLNIDTRLFPNGLLAKQTVEISGDISTGKTLLLTQLMAKCILPTEVGGLGISIVFINTEHHFFIPRLHTMLSNILKNQWGKDDEEIEAITRQSMANLTILNCYDPTPFLVSLHSLELTLLKHRHVSLLMIDSMSSFYWLHRERNGICSLDHYLKLMLRIIHKHTFQANVSLIYTKSHNTESKMSTRECIPCTADPSMENLNYRVTLENGEKQFRCKVESSSDQDIFSYVIDDIGLHWS